MKALVTGASEGIGRAFAHQLYRDGYQITAVARNEERLKELVKELGPTHQYIVADLLDENDLKMLEQKIKTEHFELLVNNAGMGVRGEVAQADISRLLEMLKLNCEVLLRLSHAYLQNARAKDAIINVSSVLAFIPTPRNGVYAASKAFVTSLSNTLWFENKKRGVYVMGLCPGMTYTQFQKRSGRGKEFYPKYITETPEELVARAMKTFRKRKSPVAHAGIKNFLFSQLSRFLPHKWLVSTAGSTLF